MPATGERLYLSPDVFLVPSDGPETLLYAPLEGLLLGVNARAETWLRELCGPEGASVSPGFEGFAAKLLAAKVLRASPPAKTGAQPPPPGPFQPTSVSLFVTGACNLRCAYCYSHGGERPLMLDPGMARIAVAQIAENATKLGRGNIEVHLHGGGEPTTAPDVLQRIVDDTEQLAAERNFQVRLSLGTNGVMTDEMARFVMRHFRQVTVSMDGPPATQNRLRPLADGSGSYERLRRTLTLFDEAGYGYSLRATIDARSAESLPALVEHMLEASAARFIKVEPVFVAGRALTGQVSPPDAEAFIAGFTRASEIARRADRHLTYSGLRPDVVSRRFCSAVGGSLCITPEGDVTACYEVSDSRDPRAARLFFGRVVPDQQRVVIHAERLSWLAAQTVDRIEECADCVAKYHCAGDCLAKTLVPGGAREPGPCYRTFRCPITQELTRRHLVAAYRANADLRDPAGGTEEAPSAVWRC